jgi:hypothetical protein
LFSEQSIFYHKILNKCNDIDEKWKTAVPRESRQFKEFYLSCYLACQHTNTPNTNIKTSGWFSGNMSDLKEGSIADD